MTEELLQQAFRLHNAGHHSEAARIYGQVLSADPRHFHALYLLGCLHFQNQRFDDAERLIARALEVDPRSLDALYNRGRALLALGRHREAIACFDRMLALHPQISEAWTARGQALLMLGDAAQGLASFERALSFDPNAWDAWQGRGDALFGLKRFPEALQSYDQSLAINPASATTLSARANVLYVSGQFDEAVATYERALAIDPSSPYSKGHLVYWKLCCCDWHTLAEDRRVISDGVRSGKRIIQPGQYMALATAAEDQRACTHLWVANEHRPTAERLWNGEQYQHGKIKLAYVSGDFCDHAVAAQVAGVLERHDKTRFETIAISLEPHPEGEMHTRLKRAFDRFIQVESMNDYDVAKLLRQNEVDIAVDLMGYTACCRPGILAFRPAPIQVNYLGYPGTSGADHMDYIIADEFVIPAEHMGYYSEKVAYLPHTYLPADPSRRGGSPASSRKGEGLPEEGFVFCSFCNSFKFTPEMFDVWMALLRSVDGSVLWLRDTNQAATRNLKREAEARGVDPARLVFAPLLADARRHIARLSLADLALDTLPYNAHATASDALMAGVPVLTCVGGTFAGRVGMSLLHAIGLPELVTHSLEDYGKRARELASDPDALSAIRSKLAQNAPTSPLFDVVRYTRDLEALYMKMCAARDEGGGAAPILC